MSLRDELEQQTTPPSESALLANEAASPEAPTDISEGVKLVLTEILLPMLTAQREAILRLAEEIDQLRAS